MCPGQGSAILSMEKGVSKGKDCVREFREGDTIHPGVGLPCHPETNGTSILLQWIEQGVYGWLQVEQY